MIGYILRNRYKILEPLGGGGFGDIYLAQDIDTLSRKCIVKHLKPKNIDPEKLEEFLPKAEKLFTKEATQLQKLGDSYTQIPTLYAYFQEDADFYLVMEYIEGHDIRQEISNGVNMGEIVALHLLQDILEVLEIVHKKNIIHRDINPNNIRRRQFDNKIVLIDFGVIKEVGGLSAAQSNFTSETISIGTLRYMPPEQAAGRPKKSSDIYSLGTMIIEALTGISPEKIPRDSRDQFEWRSHASHITPAFADYLDKMVRQDFTQRFQDATDALAALKELDCKKYPDKKTKGDQTSVIYNQTSSPSKLWIGALVLGIIMGGGALIHIFMYSNSQEIPIPSLNIPNIITSIGSTYKIDEYISDDYVWKLIQEGWVLCYEYQSDQSCESIEYSNEFGDKDGLLDRLQLLQLNNDRIKILQTQKLTRGSKGNICLTITNELYESGKYFQANTDIAWIDQKDEPLSQEKSTNFTENQKQLNKIRIGKTRCWRYYVTKIDVDGKVSEVEEHTYIDDIKQSSTKNPRIRFFKTNYVKTNLRLRKSN